MSNTNGNAEKKVASQAFWEGIELQGCSSERPLVQLEKTPSSADPFIRVAPASLSPRKVLRSQYEHKRRHHDQFNQQTRGPLEKSGTFMSLKVGSQEACE
jgi:hypothetical protein